MFNAILASSDALTGAPGGEFRIVIYGHGYRKFYVQLAYMIVCAAYSLGPRSLCVGIQSQTECLMINGPVCSLHLIGKTTMLPADEELEANEAERRGCLAKVAKFS